MLLKVVHKGKYDCMEEFINSAKKNRQIVKKLEHYGQIGVDALSAATPVDTGKTAASWEYVVGVNKKGVAITWKNTNVVDGIPIVILIQYGHGTRNGGYVQGRDFINPTMQPIFDEICEKVWKEVSGK